MTDREVAGRLKVSVDTVRRLRRSGTGPPALRVGPRAIRYRVEDVDEWLTSCGVV